ncbi:hypothetical protein [Acidiphilium sp.]|uniref:hypothetical protein n=1 Tax=Acidiphilium sp. TaxID=527 RepID=UPI00259058DF|nr:hypothetical protein [Acidiphilium sp.]
MADGRRKLRARHPARSKYNPIQVQLSEAQYRKLYDMAAVSGRSLSDMVRTLIENADHDAR